MFKEFAHRFKSVINNKFKEKLLSIANKVPPKTNPLYKAFQVERKTEEKFSLQKFTYFSKSRDERSKMINNLKKFGQKVASLQEIYNEKHSTGKVLLKKLKV